jgi:hypothetical protein
MSDSSSDTGRIRFGVVGRATTSSVPTVFVKFVHDRDDTGGYYVYTAHDQDYATLGFEYDDWVETFEDLVHFVQAAGWSIEWLDPGEVGEDSDSERLTPP